MELVNREKALAASITSAVEDKLRRLEKDGAEQSAREVDMHRRMKLAEEQVPC